MSKPYTAANYARAINVAGAIVAQEDTSDLTPKDVAKNVLDLAAELAKGQDKFFKKNDLKGNVTAPTSAGSQPSKPPSDGGTSNGGLTPKQRASASKAIKAIEENGGTAPYSLDDLEALSPEGGRSSERSAAIGVLFDTAYGN